MFDKAIAGLAKNKADGVLDELLGDGDGKFFDDELKDGKALTERIADGGVVIWRAFNLEVLLKHASVFVKVGKAVAEAVKPFMPELKVAASELMSTVNMEELKLGVKQVKEAGAELWTMLSAVSAKKKAAVDPKPVPKKK